MSKRDKNNDPDTLSNTTGEPLRPYEPDPNLTPEENANRAAEHKRRMVAAEPGPLKVTYDDLQRGTAPGKNVAPGDGNPFNGNPPIDPEILRMRREKLEDHEAQQRVEIAQQQAEAARKQGEEQRQNREEQQRMRDEEKKAFEERQRAGNPA